VPAVGVANNAAMAERLRGRELDVVPGDAIGHLGAVRPGSLDVSSNTSTSTRFSRCWPGRTGRCARAGCWWSRHRTRPTW